MFEVIPTSDLYLSAFLLTKGAVLVNIVPQPKGKALFVLNGEMSWVDEYTKEKQLHKFVDSLFLLKDRLRELSLIKREGEK